MATRVTRAERILQNLSERTGLTPSGKDFLIANLDPMHDNQLQNLVGWPDVENAASVVRCIKQSFPISKPVAIVGNWDAHIYLWPFLDPYDTIVTTPGQRQNNIAGLTGSGPNIGGLQAWGVPSGTSLAIETVPSIGKVWLDPKFSKGVGRLLGAGIEVVNTTSDLYKQGLVTSYRQSQPRSDPAVWTRDSTLSNPQFFTGQMVRGPPVNAASALLYPGTRQWHAEYGNYQVISFVGQDNPPHTVSYVAPIVGISPLNDDDSCWPVNNTADVLLPLQTGSIAGENIFSSVPGTKIYPIHSSGSIFTGLSEQTTLQVNLNLYYESFPSDSEPDILVLATPSCCYDPVALEFMSRTLNMMPVAVQAGDNASGEWFADLVDTIAKWAPKVGDMIGGPARLIGGGIGEVAKLAQGYMSPPGVTLQAPKLRDEVKKKEKQLTVQRASARAASGTVNPPKSKKKKGKTKQQSRR